MSLTPSNDNVVKLASETMSAISGKLVIQDLANRIRPTLEKSLELVSQGRAALEPEKDAIGKSNSRTTYALLEGIEVALKTCLGKDAEQNSAHPRYRAIDTAEKFWGVVSGVEVALQRLQARDGLSPKLIGETLRAVTEAYDTKGNLSEAA